MKLIDKYGRVHDYLRLSVTDKCNFRCFYCNPKTSKECNTGKESILSYEELLGIIRIFSQQLGFKKFRLTGGEPLVRKGIIDFLYEANELKKQSYFELGLTTNGFYLSDNIEKIKSAGVDRINISLDTLQKKKFKEITKIAVIENVFDGIYKSIDIGFSPVKINTVIMKNVNDDEILDFADFAVNNDVNVRFIEFMPFADNDWNKDDFLSYRDIKNIVEQKYRLSPILNQENSVAKDYLIEGEKGRVSFISSISEHFCSSCNRVRISSHGDFRLCLFSNGAAHLNFKQLFKESKTDDDIIASLENLMFTKWEKHPDEDSLKEMKSNNMFKIGG